MKAVFTAILLTLVAVSHASAADCPSYLDSEYRRLHSSESVNLCDAHPGQPMLVVNTASRCGFVGQLEGLEALHQRYGDQGLAVVGFASDDFQQEARTEAKAAEICHVNFGVTFTMIAPSAVTGDNANPLFAAIQRQSEAPSWNFNKYVLNRNGRVVAHFPSLVKPQDRAVLEAIEGVLAGGN